MGVTRPAHGPDQNPVLLVGIFVVIGGLLFALFKFVVPGAADQEVRQPPTPAAVAEDGRQDAPPELGEDVPFQRGLVVRPKPGPDDAAGPVLAPASTGRTGTGLRLRDYPDLDHLPIGPPVAGEVATAVANIPNRTSGRAFRRSVQRLASSNADFMILNEVGRRSVDAIRAQAPGYGAYRDPVRDPGPGGNQSMHNVLLWNTERWTMIDAGRVKLVENDRGYLGGRRFVWDRYATWAMFQRADGAIVSVVGTHMMTNPAKFPRQHGYVGMSRKEQYRRGMQYLRGLVSRLEVHGAVLVGGDMNSHAHQGGWSAHAQMRDHGYLYAKDRGVMYIFHPLQAQLLENQQVRVASDHPALFTRFDLNSTGPS